MGEENFQEFYTKWIGEQRQQIGVLLLASKSNSSPSSSPPLSVLVTRTLAHYEEYYATKSKCAKANVFLLLSPPWTSRLEHAFIWVGGWRPSTAFHLLFSKSGLHLQARLAEAAAQAQSDAGQDSSISIPGLGALSSQAEAAETAFSFSSLLSSQTESAADSFSSSSRLCLGELSARQLGLIDELQRSTVREERRITEKEAKQQETVADAEMVELSSEGKEEEEEIVRAALRGKEEGFEKVLRRADRLRMETLRAVVGILSPMQAVHFLIAAGELQLSLHEWGMERDRSVMCNAD